MVKSTDYWETPVELVRGIERHFGIKFTLDVCATPENAKCEDFITEEQDAFSMDWATSGICWLNPPYSRGQARKWLTKAHKENKERGVLTVALVKADTSTKWWYELVAHSPNTIFISGRVKFTLNGVSAPAPFPSALVCIGSVLSGGWEERDYINQYISYKHLIEAGTV